MTKNEFGFVVLCIIILLGLALAAIRQPPKSAPWGGGVTFQGYIDDGTSAASDLARSHGPHVGGNA